MKMTQYLVKKDSQVLRITDAMEQIDRSMMAMRPLLSRREVMGRMPFGRFGNAKNLATPYNLYHFLRRFEMDRNVTLPNFDWLLKAFLAGCSGEVRTRWLGIWNLAILARTSQLPLTPSRTCQDLSRGHPFIVVIISCNLLTTRTTIY